MFAKTIALAGLASIASAHMLISNPVPYGKSTLNNSPLEADGSNFPCKLRPGAFEAEGASNVYAQGSSQQLEFVGTAVHGGGSCQVSITTDLEPTKNSVWKVIKSIEGGCPAKNTPGNLGDNADAPDPFKYDFTIPKELAAGKYTLAWTWFNKVGNREMYMNCAPLEVTGSGGSKDHLDSLPDMFVANIGNQCAVPDGKDVLFPNAGSDVDKFGTDSYSPPTGPGCQSGSGSGGDGGSGSAPASAAPTSAAATTPVSVPTTTAASGNGNDGSNGSVPGGVFITVSDAPMPTGSEPATSAPVSEPIATQPASEPAATQPATTLLPVVSTPVSEAPVATSAAPAPSSGSGSGSGSGDSGSSFAAGTACTTEGEWNCIGGSSFQRCASGSWSAAQGLSAGVTCTPGQSADISMSAKRARKVMRRSLRIRV